MSREQRGRFIAIAITLITVAIVAYFVIVPKGGFQPAVQEQKV